MKRNSKVLIFHPTIAPYRISFFNKLYKSFHTRICLYYKNLEDNKFDYEKIEEQFVFKPTYFDRKRKIAGRDFYIGHMKKIAEYQPDVVIVGEYGEALWASVIYRFFHRRKYKILSICDDSRKIAEDCGGLRKLSRDLLLKQIDGLILCNEDVQSWYSSNKNYNSTFVFPIIQDESEFDSNYEAKCALARKKISDNELVGKRVFLFVGRLAPEKNIEYLIDSFIAQHEKHPENILYIIGGESLKAPQFRSEMQGKIECNNAQSYIIFAGRYEGTELMAWYLAGQALVLPSYYEPFGAVVNEALLSGEYVMVSDRAGASCLVNDGNGEIIDISKPLIDFENACSRIKPVGTDWNPSMSRMPYSFSDKMNGLLEWLDSIIDGKNTKS